MEKSGEQRKNEAEARRTNKENKSQIPTKAHEHLRPQIRDDKKISKREGGREVGCKNKRVNETHVKTKEIAKLESRSRTESGQHKRQKYLVITSSTEQLATEGSTGRAGREGEGDGEGTVASEWICGQVKIALETSWLPVIL